MKSDSLEQVARGAPSVVGAASTWALHEVSIVIAIIVGICTILYTVAQLAFLLRKWWLMEKRQVELVPLPSPTSPTPLDERS